MPASNFAVYSTATAVKEPAVQPNRWSLSQNYPNPFNPTTIISYSVPSPTGRDLVSNRVRDGQLPAVSSVTLAVYDILGRKVATLVDGRQSAGTHSVMFDGSGLPSGVYFYRLTAAGYSGTGKMLLVK